MSAVRYEWVRVRSVRAGWLAFAGILLLGAGATWVAARTEGAALTDPAEAARVMASGSSVLTPPLTALAVAVTAVLSCAREQRATALPAVLLALPSRMRTLVAKVLTTSVLALVVALLSLAVNAAVAVAVLGGTDLRAPGWAGTPAPRVLAAYVAYVVVAALLGLGVGILTRGSSGAAVLLAVLPAAVEPFVAQGARVSLPDRFQEWTTYLPFGAADRMLSLSGPGLSPVAGCAVFAAWAVGVLLIAAFVFHRRRA